MPSGKPRAAFEPLPPDFDVHSLVESNDRFQYVDRISCDMIDEQGLDAFDKLVLLHTVKGGKPLIIDGYQTRLDAWTFSSKWLQNNHGDKIENARNITKKEPMPLTVGHYLRNMGKLSDQYFQKPDNYLEKNRQRIYLKDIDCPPVWIDKLREQLPPNLFYLNESTGELGGPGATDEILPGIGRRQGKGIAPAGDLMSSLPPAMRAENLMCYIGHEGTYTPAHREMCASLGHNIMVENSEVLGTDGIPEKPGSSIWFMTETKDRQLVSEYWLSVLGHDIEVENHFAQINAWRKAPFTVYVVEQRAGDFLIIPPLAPHQVWNRGTRTMKVAWNRTTVDTLELALEEALPRARQVCRDEQYKNKAIVYYTLQKYHGLLSKVRDFMRTSRSPEEQNKLISSAKIRTLQKDFKKLFNMFKRIMLSEMFAPETPNERNMQFIAFESNVTCAYCRGNIFNRFLTCSNCDDLLGTTEPEPYDVCMECYAMGRSCRCISKLRWVEQFKWKELVQKYDNWRRMLIELDGGVAQEDSPLPLTDERARLSKNTLAQICQHQLKRRPFVDVHKAQDPEDLQDSDDDEQLEIGDGGTVKRKKKKRSESWLKNHRPCHVCQHRHPRWKMTECACGRFWCYGTLFRGHDLMPQQVMEQPNWRCPHCEGRCSAGSCRKDSRQKPYEPKGTLLGHDTRAVADARSVESLVDFSVSNQNWLKEDPDSQSKRFRKHQEQAKRDSLNRQIDEEEEAAIASRLQHGGTSIDPALGGGPSGPGAQGTNGTRDGSEDAYAGYQPASQSGFVVPSALMYQEPDGDEDESLFVDQDDYSSLGKRGLEDGDDSIKTIPAKRARQDRLSMVAKNKSLSSASKQYRRDHERRALEEARRKGRYIQTSAALRGKSKVIKLSISAARLRHLSELIQGQKPGGELLASDLAPPEERQNGTAGPKKITGKVRSREQDSNYSSRASQRKPIDEESDLESLHSDDFEDMRPEGGALEATASGDKRRRISSWQQQRAAEDSPAEEADEPTPVRGSSSSLRGGKAAQGSKRPRVSFNLPDNSDDSDQSDGQTTAAAAVAQVKGGAATNGNSEDDSSDENDEVIKPVASTVATMNGTSSRRPLQSLSSRGKKVKIVSAASRRQAG